MVVSLNVISLASTSFFFFSALLESDAPPAVAAAAFYNQHALLYSRYQFRLFLLEFGLLLSLLSLLLYYPKSTLHTQV